MEPAAATTTTFFFVLFLSTFFVFFKGAEHIAGNTTQTCTMRGDHTKLHYAREGGNRIAKKISLSASLSLSLFDPH